MPSIVPLLGWFVRATDCCLRPLNSDTIKRWIERPAAWLFRYPILVGQIGLYFGIAWGVVGGGFGLTDLFWHDFWLSQLYVGLSTCWLFGVVLFVNYLLHTPRNLPGLPTSPDPDLCPREFRSLFPSRNSGVRVLGNRILAWLIGLGLLLYLGKLAALAGVGDADNYVAGFWRNWKDFPFGGGFVVLGYILGLGVAYAISYFDHKLGIREDIAARPWLATSFGQPVAIPSTRIVQLVHGVEPEVPIPVPASVAAWENLPVGTATWSTTIDLAAEADRLRYRFAASNGNPAPPFTQADIARVETWADEAKGHNAVTVRLLHAMATVIGVVGFFLLVLCFIAASIWSLSRGPFYSPAVILCLVLIAADLACGFLAFRTRAHRALAFVVVAYLLAVNSQRIQKPFGAAFTFPNLTTDIAKLSSDSVDHKSPAGYSYYHESYDGRQPAKGPKLTPGSELLGTFHANWQKSHPNSKPRLVLVATSGGAMRSAVWTALVLEGLEANEHLKTKGFRNHIRIFAGASGGMVGAAAYAADFARGPLPQDQWNPQTGLLPFSAALAEESLSPIIQTALLNDFTLHTVVPYPAFTDRGRVLEEAWDRKFLKAKESLRAQHPEQDANAGWASSGSPFAVPLRNLAVQEAACECPSLIFSPTLVEDSKRLLISNLDLTGLTRPSAIGLDRSEKGVHRLDTPAIEFFRLFPNADQFRVGTAVRMSATFPVLSPAVALPTEPSRRVVDAGYFDNYGLDVIANWLLQNRRAVVDHTSGVLVVQIRAFPLEKENDQFEPVQESFVDILVGAVNAPLQAVLSARGRAAYHRNNELVDVLHRSFNGVGALPADFFATSLFELEVPAAMSWYLTEAQKKRVASGWYDMNAKTGEWMPHEANERAPIRPVIDEQVKRISAWFGDGGLPNPVAAPAAK